LGHDLCGCSLPRLQFGPRRACLWSEDSPCFETGSAEAPPTADRHRADPPRREEARWCTTEACSGVSRSTPAVRAAERGSKRGMAVNRRPLQSLRFQRTPRVECLPAHDRPAGRLMARTPRTFPASPTPAPQSWSSAPWVPTPRTAVSRTRSPAGGATETVPTSECRRRPEGTGERTSVAAPSAGSACREARVAFTLEARAAIFVPGLERRILDPDTLPSYRQPRARGPGTSRVPEPAPLRMRSRRGLRVRLEPVRASMVRRRFESSRTGFARCLRNPCVMQRVGGSFELGRAFPGCAW